MKYLNNKNHPILMKFGTQLQIWNSMTVRLRDSRALSKIVLAKLSSRMSQLPAFSRPKILHGKQFFVDCRQWCDLHWLPVRHRIDFKVAMTVFKCIHGLAPQYLADDCVLASTVRSRRHFRSADTMKLVVQRTKTVIGTRAFAVAAATVWNRLYQLTFELLRARFRHLHRNWKLFMPAGASEDFFYFAP